MKVKPIAIHAIARSVAIPRCILGRDAVVINPFFAQSYLNRPDDESSSDSDDSDPDFDDGVHEHRRV